MNTATSITAAERDALILAQLSQKLCRNDNLSREWQQFQDALGRVLSQGDPLESKILHAAIRALSSQQDEEAYVWLLNEIEVESERQFLVDPVTGKERACVLFAIPLTASVNTALPFGLYADKAFEEMHTILTQANIFDEQACVRLFPRLFTAEELRGRAKTEIRAITRSFGAQVLEDPQAVLTLSDVTLTDSPCILEDLSTYEHAQLRYLIGVAVIANEFLENLFVDTDDDETPPQKEDDKESQALGSGWLAKGVWWAQSFCERLEDCLHTLGSGFTLGMPQGFHDDMRNGLTLLREQNAMLCIDEAVQEAIASEGITADDVEAEEWPLSTPEGQVVGIALYVVNVHDPETVYASVVWPTLHHESIDDAVDELHGVLNVLELSPADELLSSDTTQPSYLLH